MTHADFMKAILATPEDDALRLVYADEIEASDPARAAFIRVQCAQAVTPATYQTCDCLIRGNRTARLCRWCTLRRRERELWVARSREWFVREEWAMSASLGDHAGPVGSLCGIVRRGFVESVSCTAASWLAHADALYWHPDQTEACWRCDGDGKAHGSDRPFEWSPSVGYPGPCPGPCKGSGRVPRPMPTTAQPIREVRLTTWPMIETLRSATGVITFGWRFPGRDKVHQAGTTAEMLAAEWPRIQFALPPI